MFVLYFASVSCAGRFEHTLQTKFKSQNRKKDNKEKENHVWQRLSWAFIPRIPIKLKCFFEKGILSSILEKYTYLVKTAIIYKIKSLKKLRSSKPKQQQQTLTGSNLDTDIQYSHKRTMTSSFFPKAN